MRQTMRVALTASAARAGAIASHDVVQSKSI